MEAYLDNFEPSFPPSHLRALCLRPEVLRTVPDQLHRDSETEGPNERIRLFPCSRNAENHRPVP